ncbi:Glutaredoxin-2, partial [Trichinella nelsoni]
LVAYCNNFTVKYFLYRLLFENIIFPVMGSAVSRENMNVVLQEQLAKDPVVIYSKSTCPACIKTRQLLKDEKIPARFYELNQMTGGNDIFKAVTSKTGWSTVPQIFICGKFVGGFSELLALQSAGFLSLMVNECYRDDLY